MSTLRLLCLLALGLLGVTNVPTPQDSPAAATGVSTEPAWVFLMRHAEKADDGTRDPDLTEAGHARAAALATLLGNTGVTHAFCSEYARTRKTVEPIATLAGIDAETVSARDSAALAAKLRELPPGSVAVVAGHSNTVPTLAKELGVPLEGLEDSRYGPVLPETEYGRLVQVVLPAEGPAYKLELSVGQ